MDERLVGGVAIREWGDPAEPAILLWPGLASTSAYYAAVAESLPGRAVAADPPGFGRSAPLDPYRRDRIVEMAIDVARRCDCYAVVGHSLGGYVACGVAADPPPGLRAAVLIDGGFADAPTMAEVGMPVTAGRDRLIAYLQENSPLFADWDAAVWGLATAIGAEPTVTIETYVREILVEVDGEIREPWPPDRLADVILALVVPDVLPYAQRVQVPTLLVACGRSPKREVREQAWRMFADSSPLIDLYVADQWGHNPVLEEPEASSRLIGEWLENYR